MSEALFIDLTEFPYDRIDLVEIIRQISVENIYDVICPHFFATLQRPCSEIAFFAAFHFICSTESHSGPEDCRFHSDVMESKGLRLMPKSSVRW